MYGTGDRQNSTTFADILHVLVILLLVGVALAVFNR
jgi:hypothetical protein